MIKHKSLLVLILTFFSFGCSGKKAQEEGFISVKINRFDSVLYEYLQNKEPVDSLLNTNLAFLNIYGERVLNIGTTDSSGFYSRLNAFFSEPTLMGLYKDEQEVFENVKPYENELSIAFQRLLNEFPELKIPEIYMHVSGLNQNVIVADSVLSISSDKYLGSDYALYKDFFYDYQFQQMSPNRIVPDYLLGFMMSEFPFKGNSDVLLDRMLYEGKLRYILSVLLQERPVNESLAYSEEQWNWCEKSEAKIWKTILQQKHLYTPDYFITSQYINDAPNTAPLNPSSPGRAGIWVGYRIISSFMKNNPETKWKDLIDLTDYQEILKLSKYKP